MNERIKELYSEAAVYAFDQRFIPGVVRELQEVITEKFAELIVRECISSIANDTANYQEEGMMAYYQGVQDAVKSIKEHFGVE
jgi:uncharacterized protein (UPF0335 family)